MSTRKGSFSDAPEIRLSCCDVHRGARVVQKEILEAVNHEKLKLQEDERQAAVKAIGHISDERAIHFWDADKSLGFSLGKVVTLPRERQLAWDTCRCRDCH